MKTLNTSILLCTASILAIAAAPSYAQTQVAATPNSGDQANDTQIETIMVTAERRSENLLAVGASVSALSSQQLSNEGIKGLTDLQLTTPGLLPYAGFGYTQIYIRGIGNNIFVGADPSVATYIDQVPRIYGTMENTFVNVDRVEVLKGAQGGLYGRNATGGVVNIITRQPGDTLEGTADLSYGEMNTFHAGAYLNVPITDSVSWNISLDRDSHDGYIKNLAQSNPYTASMFPTGSFLGTPAQTAAFFNSGVNIPKSTSNQNFWAVDSKLGVQVGSHLKLTFDADYNDKQDSNGLGSYVETPADDQATASALFSAFGINAVLPPGFIKTSTEKFTTFDGLGQPKADLKDFGGSLTAVYSLPMMDLTSITAYRGNDSFYYQDGGLESPAVLAYQVDNNKAYVYQELRATSTESGPFQYVAGATYLSTSFKGSTSLGYLPPFPLGAPNDVKTNVQDWSVYAQAGYDFTQALNLTASIRYIGETNKTEFYAPPSGAKLSESKLLPSATLKYTLPDDGTVYIRYAKGFKAGGVDPIVPPSAFNGSTFGSLFKPETVSTYEAGYRAPLFDDSVQLTTAIFYNDYQNLQTDTTGNTHNVDIIEAIVNAKKARTDGAELGAQWRAMPWLTLGTNVGYLDAVYVNFENTNTAALNPFNLNGRQMVYAPKWQYSFTADVDKPITDRYDFIASVLAAYTGSASEYYSDIPGIPSAIAPGYWLTNLKVGARTSDGKYELSLYVDNLFDQAYYTSGSTGALGTSYIWGNPRVIGGELKVNF
jgi:iron complex outermembrane receptor protein